MHIAIARYVVLKACIYIAELIIPLSNVFTQFYGKLVKTLPMNDAIFIASLYEQNLFPGNTKDTVEAKTTECDKAMWFLDNIIKHGNNISDTNFCKLLCVMEKSDFKATQRLAKEINKEMGKKVKGS